MKFCKRSLTALILAFALCLSFSTVEADTQTRAIMGDIYAAIAYLLPFSVREAEDITGLDQELLDQHLDVLASGADALAAHAEHERGDVRLLARSFKETANDIALGFKDHWPQFAYYSLLELTEHCVACHSRVPDNDRMPLGQRLLARIDPTAFSPSDLAQLMVAAREFDTALDIMERNLLDPDTVPVDADYAGRLTEYLRIVITVREDVRRPRAFFAKFLERADVPHFLAHRVRYWSSALAELRPILTAEATLPAASDLIVVADGLTQVPGDRLRAVHDLVAANLLHRFLDEHPLATPTERATAYYQLAVIALRTFESKLPVPETEFLLVAAIEADPGGPRAADAYRLLEEFGFVRDEALSEARPRQTLVDMARMRELAQIEGAH